MNAPTRPENLDPKSPQDVIPARAAPAEAAPAAPPPATPPAAPKRRLGRKALMLALPVAFVLGGGAYWLNGGRYVSTEDANLRQARIAVSAEVSGRVVEVDTADNARVAKGDVLFRVDPAPYEIALRQADAALAMARTNVAQMHAAYAAALAQARVVQDDVEFLQADYDRQRELSGRGIASAATLDEAQRNLHKAQQGKLAADQAVQSALAALGGAADAAPDTHPAVLAALAARDRAAYDLERSTVRAPADGVIYQAASFKAGQFVTPGAALFALVETGDTWIDANFKETQLTHLAVDQTAEVEFDTYPGHAFTATVQAIGAGTGAEFSLLPAQNATGNWVKVTQRIPVRLHLTDTGSGLDLRSGMSATVTVDTRQTRSLAGLFGRAAPSSP